MRQPSSQSILAEISGFVQNFSHWGWTGLENPLSLSFYENWLKQGYQGDMDYLVQHLPSKQDPTLVLPNAQTAFVFAQSYHPFPARQTNPELPRLAVSLYAQGADYHHWFKKSLLDIATHLKQLYPEFHFLPLVDSSPVLERDLAHRAGLGWFGKNSALISQKKGSLFFLGEIYSDISFSDGLKAKLEPPPDLCGKCTKCLDACPTGALIAPKILDARKCISYMNIESRTLPPVELREKWGEWFFGCDICQVVCPWNRKILTAHPIPQFSRSEKLQSLRSILESSGRALQRRFQGTALSRAGSFGLKRNAIIVAANGGFQELLPEINRLSENSKLRPLCEWANDLLKAKIVKS